MPLMKSRPRPIVEPTAKLWYGGGDVVDHSSVKAPHGSSTAGMTLRLRAAPATAPSATTAPRPDSTPPARLRIPVTFDRSVVLSNDASGVLSAAPETRS